MINVHYYANFRVRLFNYTLRDDPQLTQIDFQTDPSKHRHWQVSYQGPTATLLMDVDEQGGLFDGYELKLNSYDLGVDIELADIVQRMRFEHPEVAAIVVSSGKDKVFCAGANIKMLGGASHAHKVNFCKFTNETRNSMEAAGAESGQHYLAAVRGACAGGGYEIALACDEIYLADDSSSAVSLPEVPLLAVLPGTGGLTRVTDKRKVRRDRADVFCSVEEGVKGKRAEQWRLVDKVIANSKFDEYVSDRSQQIAGESLANNKSKNDPKGITLSPLEKSVSDDGSVVYSQLTVEIDRARGHATIIIQGPAVDIPASVEDLHSQGDGGWALRLARELDDAILHLRFNELETGVVLFKTSGNSEQVAAYEKLLLDNQNNDWLCNEILLYWKRVLKRIDLTSRSLIALVEHGSCFAGFLAEILFAADRSYMMEDEFENDDRPEAKLLLTHANFGQYPMPNDISRLQTRFLGEPESVDKAKQSIGSLLDAGTANELGLVTFIYDDIDWFDEIRVFLEERTSFSPDAMTGMEANLRFAGPETMETRIFGRLTAWQNWIFQRPNAVGEDGALQRYGTGKRGNFDKSRV